MFLQLSFDVVSQVEETHTHGGGTEKDESRTCCVGLRVWGVARWQAWLLLHYSVSFEEVFNTDTISIYSASGWNMHATLNVL